MVQQSNEEWNAGRGVVSMAANFRTAPIPLTLINRVFENLLTPAGNTYGVDFEPLAAMKIEKQGCVEFLLAASKSTDSDSELQPVPDPLSDIDPITEARLVAAHIQQLLSNNEAQPGDIALLFRKRSVFADYEKALKDLGIPVVSQQGANLFQQPELADMMAALNAVAYPHRDFVFVHYLRSPLIGFTDDLLLKIARTRGRSYYDKANVV
jgi:ATP-dependent exoDNAse (exonuclease V) beta subunit